LNEVTSLLKKSEKLVFPDLFDDVTLGWRLAKKRKKISNEGNNNTFTLRRSFSL
jgi:hypothetical protein